jgi:hypothetical protein
VVCSKDGTVVMSAEGAEAFQRVVGKGNVLGLKDIAEDSEDGGCKEVEILGTLFDDGFANVEGDLDVPAEGLLVCRFTPPDQP